jgi:hypothetical protein
VIRESSPTLSSMPQRGRCSASIDGAELGVRQSARPTGSCTDGIGTHWRSNPVQSVIREGDINAASVRAKELRLSGPVVRRTAFLDGRPTALVAADVHARPSLRSHRQRQLVPRSRGILSDDDAARVIKACAMESCDERATLLCEFWPQMRSSGSRRRG